MRPNHGEVRYWGGTAWLGRKTFDNEPELTILIGC